MNVKNRLIRIIHERLGETASSVFINKTLEIINESADSKESFLAASERISKRIALFIDVDLSNDLLHILKKEIEKISLPAGTRRKYERVLVSRKVYIHYNGSRSESYTREVSEGGMYIKAKDPLPIGTEVKIIMPLETGVDIRMEGVVVHNRTFDENSEHSTGMGIAFKEVRDDVRKVLRDLINSALSKETP